MKSRFGKYRLIAKLGQGGMAQVFLAEQSGLDGFSKRVVLKRLRGLHAGDEALDQMFHSEAMIAGQLNHPNLVHVYDFAEADGERFIVMEYVDGPTLKKLLQVTAKRRVLMPMDAALKIASLVCEGLQYAHTARDANAEPLHLVHRDITPDNIIFARNGAVKIADFGIAKATTQRHETRPGDIKGKLQYISPEQLRGQSIDGRADVFSLGVVLHQMLSGLSPFAREHDAAVMEAIVHDEVPPLNALRPEAPPMLDFIIRKATAKNRDDRWSSAAELQEALDRQIVKLSPIFGAAQLRELVEVLDPAPLGSEEEVTTTESHAIGTLMDEDDDDDDDERPKVPVGRAITKENEMASSIDIPITGAQPMLMPPPRRSALVPVMVTMVLTALITGGVTFFVAGAKPVAEKPVVETPLAEKPVVETQQVETPPAEKPIAEKPVAEPPPPEKPAEEKPAVEPPVAEKPPEEKPAAEPPPLANAPAEDQPTEPLEGRARVMLQSTPEANVFIDGKGVGRTPLALPVKHGAHKLRFEDPAAGLNKTVKLEVPAEREYSKAFVFEKARLFALAPNGAAIYVGKRKVGTVPSPVPLYEGTHTVRVVYEPTGLDVTKTIELKGGDRYEPFDPN